MRKQFSKAPDDDWSADAADAFCEGAKVMQERVVEVKPKPKGELHVGTQTRMTLDELFESQHRPRERI